MTTAQDQAPAIYHRQVGDWLVSYLNDAHMEATPDLLTGIDADAVVTLLAAAGRGPVIRITGSAYLLRRDGQVVLVDTGIGTQAGSHGLVLDHLASLGVTPDQVDTILLTHAHIDHVGGAIDGDGRAVFPRAELVASEAEHAYWLDDAARDANQVDAWAFDLARAGFAAYGDRLRLVDTGGEALPGIRLEALPGHTPGHCGYRLGELLIWGDVTHVPDVQVPRPEVCMRFDTDHAQSIATRRRVLAAAAEERLLIGGLHLHFPGFVRIVREGDAYRVVEEKWSPVP